MDDIIKSEDSVSPCLGRMWVIPPTDCLLQQLLLEGRAANLNTATKWSQCGFLYQLFPCGNVLSASNSQCEASPTLCLKVTTFCFPVLYSSQLSGMALMRVEALLLCWLGDFFLGQEFSKFINICMVSFCAYLDLLADRICPKVPAGNLRFLLPSSQSVALPGLSADTVSSLQLCFRSQVSMFLWFLISEWWASSLQATTDRCSQSTQAVMKMAEQTVQAV